MNNKFKNMAIGAVASAIAGAYYMYGSRDGEAKRKQISAWALKMKGEMLLGIEKLKDVSEPAYKDLVKKVSEKYKNFDKSEVKKVVDELQSTWTKMKKELSEEMKRRQEQMQKENEKLAAAKNKMKAGAKKTVSNVKAKVKTAVKKVVKKPVAKKSAPAVKSVEVKTETPMTEEVKIEQNN